jgi:hypothetical protein
MGDLNNLKMFTFNINHKKVTKSGFKQHVS